MKICVIGYGSIGRRHAQNAIDLGHAVCFFRTGNAHLNRPLIRENVEMFFELDEVLKWNPEIVIIANPTSLHFNSILWAMSNDLHILIEKPVCSSILELEKLITLSKNYNKKIGVSYQLRYDPLVEMAKKYISEKPNIKAMSAIIEWGSDLSIWHPWENFRDSYAARKDMGGGATLTMSHEIDLARYLFGPIISLSAHTQTAPLFGLECDSAVDALFVHKSGASSILHLDFFQNPQKRKIKVIFEFEVLEVDLINRSLTIHYSEGSTFNHCETESDSNLIYMNSLESFIEACKFGQEYKTEFFDGCESTRVCLSMLNVSSLDRMMDMTQENVRDTNV